MFSISPITHLLDAVCFGIPSIYSGAAYALPRLPSSVHSPLSRFFLPYSNAGSPGVLPRKIFEIPNTCRYILVLSGDLYLVS